MREKNIHLIMHNLVDKSEHTKPFPDLVALNGYLRLHPELANYKRFCCEVFEVDPVSGERDRIILVLQAEPKQLRDMIRFKKEDKHADTL